MLAQIQESVQFLKKKTNQNPKIGIVLGSGLGQLGNKIINPTTIPYEAIPNFPVSTVEGHSGNLIFGKIAGKDVVVMQGRFHYYEGYDMQKATFPIRVMKELGIEFLFLSNASGATNASYNIGDLMIITDHIHLFPDNPLRGKNIDELGPRFPDMSEPYSKKLIGLAEEVAEKHDFHLQKGIYMGWSGPTYETPAEYKFVKIIGADTVGMSTTPEVIVARHCGIECFGISVVTDVGVEGKIVEISHEEVTQAANKIAPILIQIFFEMIEAIEI